MRLVILSLLAIFATAAFAEDVQGVGNIIPSNVQVEQPKKRVKALPGVGTYSFSEKNTIAPVVVSAGDGGKVITVSNRFMNRIATPFKAPRIIDTTNVTFRQDDSSIFMLPTSTAPFVIYITGTEPGDQVVSFTVLPKDIPAQTIVLQLDVPSTARKQKVESYTQQIVDLLRKVASGGVPEGFSEGRMPNAVAVGQEIQILPQTRYSGSWVDVYKYSVVNGSKNVVELSETSFYKKGVRAVSIYPNIVVQPGETTNVFVIADKTALESRNGK